MQTEKHHGMLGMLSLKKLWLAALAITLVCASGANAADEFSKDTMKRMGTFVSNFTELKMYNLPDAQALTNEQYAEFGVMHEKMNNFNRFKQEEKSRASIEASHIENAVMRYFGRQFSAHCSVPVGTRSWEIQFDAKTKRYTIQPTNEPESAVVTYARVEKAENLPGGNVRMTGTLHNAKDESDRRGTFVAVARPHKWNGRDTWALLSLKSTPPYVEPVTARDLSAVWRGESGYLGVIGADGTRLRVKFNDVARRSNVEYSTSGVLKRGNGSVQKFDCAIAVDEAYLLTARSRASMGDYDDLTWVYDELNGNGRDLRVGRVSARMTLGLDDGEIVGTMRSTIIVRPGGEVEMESELDGADGWCNNEFSGKAHIAGENLPCAFGLGRIPLEKMPESVRDIDQGAGEMRPADKYIDKGWRSRIDFLDSLEYDAIAALGIVKDAEPVDRSSVDPAKLAHAIEVINEELYWYSDEAKIK